MAKKHYEWEGSGAEIHSHSLTKHDVLCEYLQLYFARRTLNRRGAEHFRITLVDGFCGGGRYRLKDTGKEVLGSPLRMIEAVAAAQAAVSLDRTKPLTLDVQYVFIDKDPQAIASLRRVLSEQGHGRLDGAIRVIQSDFAAAAETVLDLVRQHTPRASTAIFFLDQYGYTEVPTSLIRTIFSALPNSEIVLTFHVSSFATYTNDELSDRISRTLQIDLREVLGGRSIEDLKADDADWRRFIQGALYQALVKHCNARFFTPFFIRGAGAGHGEYWLVHLSQHHRAQDVMKQVHWAHHNHFVSYGGAGLDTLAPQTMGFMQAFDGGFKFDDVARQRSDQALHVQLARNIVDHERPRQLGEIYAQTCNGSPATSLMYKHTLERLVADGDVTVIAQDGKVRRAARYMTDTDIVEPSRQRKLFLPA